VQNFGEYRENRHDEARKWKRQTGGKVIGTICCCVPEELIHAAGILPVRLLGEHEPNTEADLHFPSNLCPYCKSWFDQLLKGRYDYLDGVVVPNACNIVKSAYGFAKRLLDLDYVHFLDVPQRISAEGIDFFTYDLGNLKKSLEDFSGKKITDTALKDSITVYNDNRSLLEKLYALRRKSPSPVSGPEVQAVVISSMLMPKEEHNRLLSQLLKDIEKRHGDNSRVRLFISASILDDIDFLELVEECGGTVVADDMPFGSRYFFGNVSLDGDLLRALAERYLTKIACPRKMLPADRLAFSMAKLAGAEVSGAIIHAMRACDPHLYEYPLLRLELEKQRLPVLFFRGEETETEREQQKADIEAFIEMIRDRAE